MGRHIVLINLLYIQNYKIDFKNILKFKIKDLCIKYIYDYSSTSNQ